MAKPKRTSAARRLKPVLALITVVILAILSWKLLTAPTLRVSPDAARAWMTELDLKISKRAHTARESDERVAINIDFGSRTVDPQYLFNLNRTAHQVRFVRMVLLEPASVRFQQDMLADIAELATALEHCGDRRCADVITRLEVLTEARGDSVAAVKAADDIMARSYDMARPGAVDVGRPDTVAALTELVSEAVKNESLLALEGEGGGFADVNHYSTALWEIVDIHAEMTEAFEREHRFVTVLQLLLGRLP